MKYKLMGAIGFVTFFLLSAVSHPFYLSITEMDYNAQNQSLEVSIKLFTDNLEAALISQKTPNSGSLAAIESPDIDKKIEQYLSEKFLVIANGKPVVFTFRGKEVMPDVTWCYLEGKNISAIKTLKVKNLLLLEVYDSQKNIVHLDVNGNKKSLLLQRGKVEEEVQF
ncbi:MAG: DUF6702 family protein [Bacteroidia bacterium]|nr:DUF6702 family protein [Bacteroidia bacterium]